MQRKVAMENLTAKQLEEKIGFGRYSVKGGTYALWIGEFCFFLYIDTNINGGRKVFINIDNTSSDFTNSIDLQKQYTTTDSVEKDIRKQLYQLHKRITKALNE